MGTLPAGGVTFLFTDIENVTYDDTIGALLR
jgi:hypothetical protein